MSPRARTQERSRTSRVELIVGDEAGGKATFARDVAAGLAAAPKAIPSRWLLDAAGVALLRKLRAAPTSYLVRAERQLLADRAYSVPLYFQGGAPRVIETGVGDAARTAALLGPLLDVFGEIAYTAIGPDRTAVEESCQRLVQAHPGLRTTAMVGRLEDAVRDLRVSASPVLLFWPNGGVGDGSRLDAMNVLRGVGAALRPRDLLIATVDLRKDPRLVQRVYRDRAGIAKQLHLNLLERINNELGGTFDISSFRHRFSYDETAGELESHLVCRRSQVVRIEATDSEFSFVKGDPIHTLTVTKCSPQEIDQMAHNADLTVHERWYDRDGQACANLMRPGARS